MPQARRLPSPQRERNGAFTLGGEGPFNKQLQEETAVKFMIWSQKEKAWWRPEGLGYTKRRSEAGRFTIEEAMRHHLNGVFGDFPKSADMLVCARE